jgi:hypothetical protein
MRRSFELFHGDRHPWFLRCDQASLARLAELPLTVCKVFTEAVQDRPDPQTNERSFRPIVAEKMNVLADAWECQNWEAALFLDADLLMTAPILEAIAKTDGEVILTPHYFCKELKYLDNSLGYYNSGFVCAKSRVFHQWWREAFITQPAKWTDQAVLNDARAHFAIGELPDTANIGSWRHGWRQEYGPIPPDCMFLHVHYFQPLHSFQHWINRSFALHCLKFLRSSAVAEHQVLFREIMAMDSVGWYEASLRIC